MKWTGVVTVFAVVAFAIPAMAFAQAPVGAWCAGSYGAEGTNFGPCPSAQADAQVAGSASSSHTLTQRLTPRVSTAVAFAHTRPLRELAKGAPVLPAKKRLPPERGPFVPDRGFLGDSAVQSKTGPGAIPSPNLTFEGLSNTDNQNRLCQRNPVGDNHCSDAC